MVKTLPAPLLASGLLVGSALAFAPSIRTPLSSNPVKSALSAADGSSTECDCLVIGGGNLFRGAALNAAGMDRVTGDHMGMLATVMNALAMRDALERTNISSNVMSAIPMSGVVEHYDRRRAIRYLKDGEVVIFAAGTGNPFFTTDSAACLRGIEINADVVLKATKVDGVYSADPMLDPSAELFSNLTYDQVLDKKLGVMDLTAICLCREHNMPLRVFRMSKQGALLNLVVGGDEGTLIEEG